jgi:hypothetical protein
VAYGPFPDISRAVPDLAALHTRLHTSGGRDEGGQNETEVISTTSTVGARGFEPPTPRSRTECATRLRYAPFPPRALALAIAQGGLPL